MKAETVAARLSEELTRAAAQELQDEDVIHAVERLILDSAACALGALDAAPVTAAHNWARTNGGGPVPILGTRQTSSVTGATLANCTLIRQLDMNDCDWASDPAHPSDNIGGCLAVAGASGASAMSLIKAILIAYEVQMRSTEFTRVSFFREIGWDHTTFVTLATAAGAGTLLGLDATRLAHALAIAGSYPTIGELRVGQISMMKAASAGLAASRGVEAAYLASFGVTGPLAIFEGKRGMAKLMLGECDWELFAAPIGQWRLPRTCLKQYPAAYIIHASIDAALSLHREYHLRPSMIDTVEVAGFGWLIEDMVHGMGGRSRYDIDARETADHSLPYCVAAALLDGEYTHDQLANKRWQDADLKDMLTRVQCVHDPDLDGGFPARRPGRVSVRLRDGRTISKQVDYPKGDPRNPLSDDDLAQKLRRLSANARSAAQQHAAIAVALGLRSHGVRELFAACALSSP
jgi:2-methylcitrate dehydratase